MTKKQLFFIIIFIIVIIVALILNFIGVFKPNNSQNSNTSASNTNTQKLTNISGEMISKDIQKCESSEDCIIMDTHPCCTCNNGGGQIALNSHYQSFWQQRLANKKLNCEEAVCAAVYNCVAGRAACVDNICSIQ